MTESVGKWLTVRGAAEYLGLSMISIRRMLARHAITAHYPVRGRVLIDRDELDRAIKATAKPHRKGRGIRRAAKTTA